MTATKNLEESGTLADHPFAQLLVEIAQARFDGALRIESGKQKAVVYFRTGEVVYAATNSKSLRLFNLLLRQERIDAKTISRFANFANDVEFGAWLVAQGIVERKVVDEFTVEQVDSIIFEALQWPDGQWSFSPLVRIREELAYPIDLQRILVAHARSVSSDRIYAQFSGLEESFAMAPAPDLAPPLEKHEELVLSKLGERSMDVAQIRALCHELPDDAILHALYMLWLGGFIVRREWKFAFSASRVGTILTARVSKVRSAEQVNLDQETTEAASEPETQPTPAPEPSKLPATALTLDEYLAQVEGAITHYDILGVATEADVREIKNAYFSYAKQFHPDRYHREAPDVLKRIQSAFTAVAHAHETLRDAASRAAYDDKMRKELEQRERRKAEGKAETMSAADRQVEQALENFEEGIAYLNDEEYDEAAKYLARAVHLSPHNALFQAYLGQALSGAGPQYRHKAEGAFNTAVRLDPKNSQVRLMLVEFLVEQKMIKRAEGELTRFLELVPNDKDAAAMLAKLRT